MNAQPTPESPAASATVDASNPWLGLASFTEDTRAYFFGREEETAELARRVQRKLLTVLFGKSGLGKTSILRAGLVPRLAAQGYCPVYVRIDYGRDAPEPAEQIKEAIRRIARHAGRWTQVGVAVEGESLWEFLHHRDDLLLDESGAPLIPLLIFDQFEEIFTLAQGDDFGRTRAARFVEELADLVENRMPQRLEAALEEDPATAERFDFARGDYRVLIALREDYLAPLESLKKTMPSVAQNRLRLAPMSGQQALAAVLQPGGRLVSEEVAAAIVRFVAGGAELANAEVEPSLLSLICRELNDARIAAGRDEISLDLLAGSHASILSNFYERSLADQPAAVRRIIEDDLLTDSGFRENVAEESLRRRLDAAGAAPGTLSLLVNRRLLRIEERLDVRRVELTHDVLCSVVKDSRDQRHEREAREHAELVLAEQRERERAARHALVRARQIALACTLLAVAAIGAAIYAYFSGQRARRAEAAAQETRALAEQGRSQAERLLGYLTDDFVGELESLGRLQTLAEFTQRQIDYFHALPAALRGPDTVRNGALALIHHGRAVRTLGDLEVAEANSTEALRLLEDLRSHGDTSETTQIDLALARLVLAQVLDNRDNPEGVVNCNLALSILQPLIDSPKPSRAAREAYVEVLVRRTFEQQYANQLEDAIKSGAAIRKLAAELGALDLSNLHMTADYAEGSAWMIQALIVSNRDDEATRMSKEVLALTDRLLQRRPGYRLALHAEQLIESNLGVVALNEFRPAEALADNQRSELTSQVQLKLDPNNIVTINNLGVSYSSEGDALWQMGRLRDALPRFKQATNSYASALSGGNGFAINTLQAAAYGAARQAMSGHVEDFDATLHIDAVMVAALEKRKNQEPFALYLGKAFSKLPYAELAFQRDDYPETLRIASQAADDLRAGAPNGAQQEQQGYTALFQTEHLQARALYMSGHYADAVTAERNAIADRRRWGDFANPDRREIGVSQCWLAMALARSGQKAEALKIIEPIIAMDRQFATQNKGDSWLNYELGIALYAKALANPTAGPALLAEAQQLIAGLAPELRPLHDTRMWQRLMAEAQKTAE